MAAKPSRASLIKASSDQAEALMDAESMQTKNVINKTVPNDAPPDAAAVPGRLNLGAQAAKLRRERERRKLMDSQYEYSE